MSPSVQELQPIVDQLAELGIRVRSGSIVIHLDADGRVKLVETKQTHRPRNREALDNEDG